MMAAIERFGDRFTEASRREQDAMLGYVLAGWRLEDERLTRAIARCLPKPKE